MDRIKEIVERVFEEVAMKMAPVNSNTPCEARSINDFEAASIRSLIAYGAYKTKENEEHIKEALETLFSIGDIKNLEAEHFESAVRLLVDFSVVHEAKS